MTEKTPDLLRSAAARLLADAAFQSALDIIRQEVRDDLLAEEDKKRRNTFWHEYRALERIKSKLVQFASSGSKLGKV